MQERIAAARMYAARIGNVYVSPDGTAHHPSRIGQLCNGVAVSTSEMSDAEVAACGLTGSVKPASETANRLHGSSDSAH